MRKVKVLIILSRLGTSNVKVWMPTNVLKIVSVISYSLSLIRVTSLKLSEIMIFHWKQKLSYLVKKLGRNSRKEDEQVKFEYQLVL